MSHESDISEELGDGMDAELQNELIQTFILEFDELMDIYKDALKKMRSLRSNKVDALQDIFRVYHTLKGDAAYFDEFHEFVKFSSAFCDRLRNPNEEMLKDQILMRQISLNYSRLSSAFSALKKGNSLRALRFKILLRNF